jgi:hypothetical protein
MNTYDPADRIVYLHLATSSAPPPAPALVLTPTLAAAAAPAPAPARPPVVEARPCSPLPAGYANQSPRTRLRSDTRSAPVPAPLSRRTA